MPVRNGIPSQELDVQGSLNVDNTRILTDESNSFGAQISTGTGDTIGGAAPTMTLTDSGATFTAQDVGRFITLSGATTGANNGTFMIVAFTSGTVISYDNAAGVAEAFAGTWTIRKPYSLEDDINFERTDRKNIKGTASHTTAVPVYQRPTAVGTNVPADLTNIAGKTLDAFAQVVDVRFIDRKLRPSIAETGSGTVAIADETFTTSNNQFVAGDLNSFITLVDGTAIGASGTYRIKVVTDGKTLELDGLNPTLGGSVDWTLKADIKAILSSSGHADAVDRTGIPIADTGAEDQTVYAATFADLINPISNGGATNEAGLRIFCRTFGAGADPSETTSAEGTRFYEKLYTGLNDGTATVSSLESISGRTGSAASVTNASTTVTGLTAMQQEDVGLYLTIYGTAVDGNQRHVKITSFISTTSVTVAGANFATDANSGSLKWKVSRHPGNWDFYTPLRQRSDQVSETSNRGLLIGGIVSDSELTQDVLEIRESVGISDGVSSLAGLLTNTTNYFPFVNLPDALPSAVEALNTLNIQIGNRDYTGAILTDGQTITASLQALATAISASSFVRTVERLTVANNANVARTVPAAQTYTIDGSNNGQYLTLYWTKLLRDPGPVVTDNDYAETSTTSFTPYTKIKAGDHVNYYIYA